MSLKHPNMFEANIVMIFNFMCQLDWAQGVQTTSKILFLGESAKVFLGEDFQGSKSILCDAPGADTCHYTFVKAQRMYNNRSEPWCKLWTLNDDKSKSVHGL